MRKYIKMFFGVGDKSTKGELLKKVWLAAIFTAVLFVLLNYW